jgi:uncharacterized membrane protein YbhN (UPF0104 family)
MLKQVVSFVTRIKIGWKPLLKIAISVIFGVFLYRTVDLGEITDSLHRIRLEYFVSSYIVLLASEWLIVLRLAELMKPMQIELSKLRLLRVGFIAKFYAIVLPAGVGQTAAKWFKITENRTGRLQFAFVLVVEKSLFLLTTILCVGVPLIFVQDERTEGLRRGLVPFLLVISIAILCSYVLILIPSAFRFGARFGTALGRKIGGKLAELTQRTRDLEIYVGRWQIMVRSSAASLLFQAAVLLRMALLFQAVEVSLPWSTIIWVSAFVFFIQAMPVSFAGLGVRESAFAYAFNLYGLGGELGVLVGLLFFCQMIINAVIGFVLELTDRGGSRTVRAREGGS